MYKGTHRGSIRVLGILLGGPFDLVSGVSKVGYGDYDMVSRGY